MISDQTRIGDINDKVVKAAVALKNAKDELSQATSDELRYQSELERSGQKVKDVKAVIFLLEKEIREALEGVQ